MKIPLLVNVGSLEKRTNQLKYYCDKKNEKSKDYCTADLLQNKNWLHVQASCRGLRDW